MRLPRLAGAGVGHPPHSDPLRGRSSWPCRRFGKVPQNVRRGPHPCPRGPRMSPLGRSGGCAATGDPIPREEPFPSPHQVRKELAPRGYALTERLCVYPQYMDPEWMEQGVLDVVKLKYWSFIPRRGSGRRSEEKLDGALAERAIAKGREGNELSEDELTALFAETRPAV